MTDFLDLDDIDDFDLDFEGESMYCDECDTYVSEWDVVHVLDIPIDLMYRDAGSDALVCDDCLTNLGWTLDDEGYVEQVDLDREGDPNFNGAW
jgi:hypothetical protein